MKKITILAITALLCCFQMSYSQGTIYEAENIYTELHDPDGDSQPFSTNAPISGSAIKLYDDGDYVKLSFSPAKAGVYILKIQVRSGKANEPYFFFPKYKVYVNGVLSTFTGDNNSVNLSDIPPFNYFGKLVSGQLTLGTGAQEIKVENNNAGSVHVDYIEVVPVYTLTLNSVGSGTASVSVNGGNLVVTATPNLGHLFTNWTGGATSTNNPYTFTLTANTTLTANFTQQSGGGSSLWTLNGSTAYYTNKVAIGSITTVPTGYQLSVEGKIITEGVRVKLSGSWPDYVFEPNYVLPNLEAVEAYIQQHGHLPEVPSAKEVSEEGNDLGNMDAILLKKIEELTLYIIELKKEVEVLKTKIKE